MLHLVCCEHICCSHSLSFLGSGRRLCWRRVFDHGCWLWCCFAWGSWFLWWRFHRYAIRVFLLHGFTIDILLTHGLPIQIFHCFPIHILIHRLPIQILLFLNRFSIHILLILIIQGI